LLSQPDEIRNGHPLLALTPLSLRLPGRVVNSSGMVELTVPTLTGPETIDKTPAPLRPTTTLFKIVAPQKEEQTGFQHALRA
jgi:hypothetical protein